MHRNFSFPLPHCHNAMDVLQMQMQHCNKYQNNQDLSLLSGSDILPICCQYIDPAERVRFMTCRLTSDISTKEFQHQLTPNRRLFCIDNIVQMNSVQPQGPKIDRTCPKVPKNPFFGASSKVFISIMCGQPKDSFIELPMLNRWRLGGPKGPNQTKNAKKCPKHGLKITFWGTFSERSASKQNFGQEMPQKWPKIHILKLGVPSRDQN